MASVVRLIAELRSLADKKQREQRLIADALMEGKVVVVEEEKSNMLRKKMLISDVNFG